MITNKLDVRSALVSFSLVVFGALGFVACAAPVESGEEVVSAQADEQVGETQQALPVSCCYGYLTCPTTGTHYPWYTGVRDLCGEVSWASASTNCNNHCGPACVNTQTGCLTP